jgi:hypothetical protein
MRRTLFEYARNCYGYALTVLVNKEMQRSCKNGAKVSGMRLCFMIPPERQDHLGSFF